MYDAPPPYSGIFQNQQQQQYKFDERNRVTTNVTSGFFAATQIQMVDQGTNDKD